MSSTRAATRASRSSPSGVAPALATPAAISASNLAHDLMAARSSSSRTPHRVTVRKTAAQVARLQEIWASTTTPTKEQREQIADEIGLDTRIVSTWFRDERSKLTRQRAEQQRTERGTVGPVRNTRTNSASIVVHQRTQSIPATDAVPSDIEEETLLPFDRYHHHHQQSPSTLAQPLAATTSQQVHLRASPDVKSITATKSPSTRYAPYPVPKTPPQRHGLTQRHFDLRPSGSAPIDIHRPHQHQHHRSNLSVETDTESLLLHSSPGHYPSLSVPAPSVDGDSSDSSEDELEEDNEFDEYGSNTLEVPFSHQHGPHRDYSLRTPVHLPSSLPSPRVMHAPSSSIPTGGLPPISTIGVGIGPNGSFSPPTKAHSSVSPYLSSSPARHPITLPTTTGGTYTFEPLPVLLGPQPNRDSSWRWNYYDKVSSMRHTLSDKLYHKEPTKSSAAVHVSSNRRSYDRADDESDEEDGVLSDALSASPSPTVQPVRLDGGVLDRLGGLFVGGGKKQFFATPATYSDFSRAG